MSWGEFENKMYKILGKKFKYVDELYYNIDRQIQLGENIELDDVEALECLQSLHTMNGELCVITDYCYEKQSGPFIVDAKQMKDFVKTFFEVYGEAFYSTDIIIINFTEKRIWVLFHEGICWLSRGK